MTHQLAIIGAGRVAKEHARAIQAIGATIAAVCDQDQQAAQRFAKEHGGAVATYSLDELLAMTEVPAVVVAVPNHQHRDVSITCLRAGKDVLLEKPMAMNVAQCDEIIAAAHDAGRILQMGFVCRYAPRVALVRDLINSGALGSIYHARATMTRKRGIPGLGRWFTTKALSGGGVLIDIGVHLIDLVMHLIGESRAARVSAVCESRFGSPIDEYVFEDMWAGPPDPTGTFDVEDAATGLIRFESGFTFELNVTWAANMPDNLYRDGLLLLGDKGGCFFDLWGDQFIITRERGGKVIDEQPEDDNADAWNRAWNGQHEAFRQCVLEQTQPDASGEAGRHVQAIIEAMYESSAGQREVAVRS